MVFLLFDCRVATGEPRLNEEFSEFAWVSREKLGDYDLNPETRDTFRRLGWLAEGPHE
jgi:nucleoside triphosphatase